MVIPRHPIYRIGYKLVSFFVFRGPGIADLAGEIIWQGTFDGRFEDKTYAIGVFERHSAEVQQRVPGKQAARLRCKGRLGTPVRVPRGRSTRRTIPPHERHGGDAAPYEG